MLSPSLIRSIYILLAALAGAGGTGYEVLYNRALASILGHTYAVNASILVSFLFGLSLGSLVAHRFLRYLWLTQIGLGLYTIVFFWLISASGSYGGAQFLYFFSISHSSALLGACLLTFLPALLVGMAVPMFSAYIKEHFTGHPFRIAYMVYNLGAIGGVLFTEFFLLRMLPMSKTAFFMGSVNIAAGFFIFFLSFESRVMEGIPRWRKVFPPKLLLSLFILSISSSIFQLFFLKTVYYTTGRLNANFALSLSTVLFYLSAGTFLIQKKPSVASRIFPAATLSMALWLASQPAILYLVSILNSMELKLSLPAHAAWILSPVLLGFPLLFFGASVPACLKSAQAVGRDSGILLLVSGLGNVLGYLLFSLIIHPNLEIRYALGLGAAIAILSIIIMPEISNRNKIATISLSLFLIFVGFFTWNQGLYFVSVEGYRSYSTLKKHSQQTTYVEEFPSHDQTFALRHYFSPKEGKERQKFFIDGYVSLDLPSEESLAGSIAAMYANQRNRLLVLGFGTGMSAGAASVFFKQVDMVELNPEVVRLQDRFSDINFNVHRLPKTRVFQGDGFQYLLEREKKYDMIISTVTAPFYPASSKMYTDEFFHLAAGRLNPGGIFSAWFDVRLHPDAVPILFKTLGRHFSHCAMNYVYDAYYLLACSDRPLKGNLDIFHQGEVSLEEYEKVVGGEVQERLRDRALIPNVLEPHYLKILGVREETVVNSLDWPHLEFFHPEKARRYHASFMKRLLPFIDFGYSLADQRPLDREEFAGRCQSLRVWFEDAEPECQKQFKEKFGGG